MSLASLCLRSVFTFVGLEYSRYVFEHFGMECLLEEVNRMQGFCMLGCVGLVASTIDAFMK